MIIVLLRLVILLSLTSCKGPLGRYIMRPAGEYYDRDCVYHRYGRLPECKNYNFLPVDEGVVIIPDRPVVFEDYQQYRGRNE